MLVRDVMRSSVIAVNPETPLIEAIALLMEHHISGLPVVDADRRIVGVLTEKDLLLVYGAEHKPKTVAEQMTRAPVTVAADAPLSDAFDLLMSRSFRRLLVEERGRLVGLVSRADLMPAILDTLRENAR